MTDIEVGLQAWMPREVRGQKGSVLHETLLGWRPWCRCHIVSRTWLRAGLGPLVLSHEWQVWMQMTSRPRRRASWLVGLRGVILAQLRDRRHATSHSHPQKKQRSLDLGNDSPRRDKLSSMLMLLAFAGASS
jgi:hypothetical protein